MVLPYSTHIKDLDLQHKPFPYRSFQQELLPPVPEVHYFRAEFLLPPTPRRCLRLPMEAPQHQQHHLLAGLFPPRHPMLRRSMLRLAEVRTPERKC